MIKKNLFLDASSDSESINSEKEDDQGFSLKDSNLLDTPTNNIEDVVPTEGFYEMIECTILQDDDSLNQLSPHANEKDSLDESSPEASHKPSNRKNSE